MLTHGQNADSACPTRRRGGDAAGAVPPATEKLRGVCRRRVGSTTIHQSGPTARPAPHTTLPRYILLTGAAGFIGSHVARLLLDRGDTVVGLDNLNAYYDPQLKHDRLARLTGDAGFRFVS